MSRPAHRPVRVAFVLLCLTLTLTLVPFASRTAAAAGSVRPGDLVAYLDRGNNLWVSNSDGSAARQLTQGGFGDVAWSPDGSRLAAAGPYNGGQGVYLTSPDGSLPLKPLSAGAKPAWAPDSGDLALIDGGTIAVFSRDGANVRSAAVGADTLRWSPNAHVVGYTRIVADPYGTNCPVRALGWFDAASGQSKEVARSIGAFAWAYDGNRLLYVSADDGDVHSFDITSGANRTLSTRTADPCAGPFFTTTQGDQLLFLDEAAGGTTLVALNVDSAKERVYPNLPVGFPASVLPAAYVGADVSGSFVDLVQAYPTRITRLDLASGTLTTLLSDEWRGVLAFSPDHRQVVLVDNPYGKPTVASIRDLQSGQEVAFKYVGWLTFEPSAITSSSFLAWSRTWAREDRPVAAGAVQRTWVWGPSPFAMEQEQYADAPGGRRPVLYYDKSRMEINTPSADQSSQWYVTNGLLAKELITGQMQVGNDPSAVVNRGPAQVNVAGDTDDPNGPTYASLTHLRSAPPAAVGSEITATLSRSGAVGSGGPGGVHATQLVSETDHTIADVFWAYLTSQGPIWDGARITSGQLFDPTFFATGFPITEAYWARVKVGGVERDVLLQCFERRCLTYTPSNPDGWKVEMGNVGRHYYAWRYGG